MKTHETQTQLIDFNRPFMTGREIDYIKEAYENGHLSANGAFTKKCQERIQSLVECREVFLTHSATAALESTSLLANIQKGDEILMPSYTFVSMATAFAIRGAVPVFVDVREDTLNLDEKKIEEAITNKTKAIVVVHYAGVGCEMDTIMQIAQKHDLFVIEDAAHGICASYKGRSLGSIGHMAALSFHETKNIISGEGGALLINDNSFESRAAKVVMKGTNRRDFEEGLVNKYTWVDIGSSYQPSELIAAFLLAQLEEAQSITQRRLTIWKKYHDALEDLEDAELLRRPVVPQDCQHNAHMYYILLPHPVRRTELTHALKKNNIHAVSHYVPLHMSSAGREYGLADGSLPVSEKVSQCLLRLPLWLGMEEKQEYIIEKLITLLS